MGLIQKIASSAGVKIYLNGQTELVAAEDLVKFLEEARARYLHVVGLEGFRIADNSLTPDMDAIADFSSIVESATSENTIDEALMFLSVINQPELYYEVRFIEST